MAMTNDDDAGLRRPSTAINTSTEMEHLLRCVICLDRVHDAHLCPSCSSMCCRPCIVKWITERKAQCPHCQVELRVEHLVNCRFVQDLTRAVDRLQSSLGHLRELCPVHRNELLYYCTNCSQCICADCAMFSSTHAGHCFEKLGSVHDRHARLISAEIVNLESRLATLRQVETSIDTNIAGVNAAKDEAIYTLQSLTQAMEKSIMQQLKDKLLILESQRNEVGKELSVAESVVHELRCYLDPSICAKSELIRNMSHLRSMAKETDEKPLSRLLCRESVSDAFHSELIPTFSESSFTIANFMETLNRDDVLYSETLFRNGYTWRLKVYPNGNGTARDHFISVFLELIAGLVGPEQIEYAVQMVNHRDLSKAITRRFCSRFEVGESWGYNRFFRIDVLIRDGYISEHGSLVLKFFVRPPSMHLANLEQQKYIAALELSQVRNRRTIRALRKRMYLMAIPFAATMTRRSTSGENESVGDGEDDGEDIVASDAESQAQIHIESSVEHQSLSEFSDLSDGELNRDVSGDGDECMICCEPVTEADQSQVRPLPWDLTDQQEPENLSELDNMRQLSISCDESLKQA